MAKRLARHVWRFSRIVLLPVLGLAAIAVHCLPAAADPSPINERPMYGGVQKTPEMLEADRAFISMFESKGISRDVAANDAVERGWRALHAGDLRTAIKRFNQAWLLDPENGASYWGMAAVVGDRDRDFVQTDALFQRALELLADDSDLHVDYGRFLSQLFGFERRTGNAQKASDALERSTTSFRRALELNPKARDAHAALAQNLFLQQDLDGAYRHLRTAIERGEGKGFTLLPIIKCMMDKGIDRMEDPRAMACAP